MAVEEVWTKALHKEAGSDNLQEAHLLFPEQ